jgi:Terminase large subunit, T4likevirus-type, N-terminal
MIEDSDTDPYAWSQLPDPTAQRAARSARIAAAFGKLGKPEKKFLLDQLCVVDPVAWAKARAGFNLDPWQKAFLRTTGNTAVVAGRRVGKTAVVAIKAAHHIAVAEELGVPDRTALVIAPSLRQATETTRAARAALAKALPGVEFASDNKLQIELPWGARLIALPGEASTSRGFTASMAIAEESQSLEHADEIFATIAPTLATTGGPLIVVGTPMDYQDPLYPIFEGDAAHDQSWTRFRIPTRGARACRDRSSRISDGSWAR